VRLSTAGTEQSLSDKLVDLAVTGRVDGIVRGQFDYSVYHNSLRRALGLTRDLMCVCLLRDMRGDEWLITPAVHHDDATIGGRTYLASQAARICSALFVEPKVAILAADGERGYLAAVDKSLDDAGSNRCVLFQSAPTPMAAKAAIANVSIAFPTVVRLTRACLRWRVQQTRFSECGRGVVTPCGERAAIHWVLCRDAWIARTSEPGMWIPAVPAIRGGGPAKLSAIIYVDGAGKASATAKIESWMSQGTTILAIDGRGLGELAAETRANEQWFGETSNISAALLLGKTMVGMRALDILRGVELLVGRPDVDSANIKVIGVGRASVPLLYAAAFDERIKSLELEGILSSYQSIIDSRLHRYAYEQVLPGVIRHFDLADLVKAIAPQTVSMRGSVDAMGMSEVR
jgi:hypothetical protein